MSTKNDESTAILTQGRRIDSRDRQILALLQEDARISNAEIARAIDLAPSAVFDRIRGLKRSGVLRGCHGVVDRRRIGFTVLAFVEVHTEAPLRGAETIAALRAIDGVTEIHDVAGDACFLVKIVARDLEDLHQLVNQRVASAPQVRSTRTTIVLKSFKESTALPLAARLE